MVRMNVTWEAKANRQRTRPPRPLAPPRPRQPLVTARPLVPEAQNAHFGFNFLTFLILYNNLIPISLQVTAEIVRFFQVSTTTFI